MSEINIFEMDANVLDHLQTKIKTQFEYWPQQLPPLGEDKSDWAKACLHPNGYLREKALKKLSDHEDTAAIPFLFLRLIDGVAVIRTFASAELIKRLRSKYAEHILRQVPFWVKIKQRSKVPGEVLESLESYLKEDPVVHDVLCRNFDRLESKVRRDFFAYMLEGRGRDPVAFLLRSFHDADTHIRFLSLQQYKKFILSSQVAAQFYAAMAHNPLMPLRREALFLALENLQLPPEKIWVQALMDRHSSIRDLAQYHLRQMGQDCSSIYRAKLNESSRIPILGLGETGTRDDIRLITPFLHHSDPAIVQASIHSLHRLGAEFERQSLYEFLEHPSSKISKEAYQILFRQSVDRSDLIKIFQQTALLRIKKRTLHLSSRLEKWDKLHFLLEALQSFQDDSICQQIVNWYCNYNRSSSLPNPEHLSKLKQLLLQAKVPLNSSKFYVWGMGENLFDVLHNLLVHITAGH